MRVGVDGVTGGMRHAMDGVTARPDGIDVSGRRPAARIKGGGNTPRPALCKPEHLQIITTISGKRFKYSPSF